MLRKSIRYVIRDAGSFLPSIQRSFSDHRVKFNLAISSQEASIDMSTKVISPQVPNTVITVPDPDNKPIAIHCEVGGRMEWRSNSPNYPKFEIHFPDTNPFDNSKGYTKSGAIDKPVILHPKTGGHYRYSIKHHPSKPGVSIESGPFLFSVHPCAGCPDSG